MDQTCLSLGAAGFSRAGFLSQSSIAVYLSTDSVKNGTAMH